ncbi:hypothetical protein CVS40_3392 [Lucilia cuprina]|nr:hypothetical protein CVS40_3392 [Lucilia cuprina]
MKMYESVRYISSSEAIWRIFAFPIHERYPPLLSFFELCKVDEFAKTLLYTEIPSYYVLKSNQFERRKRGKRIEGWEDIRKDDELGRLLCLQFIQTILKHPTFYSACLALGLLEDDKHWDNALAVASSSIAATLLIGGKTAQQLETPICNISKQSNFAYVLKQCKLIVWDASTMAH